MLTNSRQKKKRGPKETHTGNIYALAHQAYWGLRFLAERKHKFWQQILDARTVKAIQEVGRACSQPGSLSKAGYGAKGLMNWLKSRRVATQVLKAKRHRRYPGSDRPSSEDRRMIFLGIAVAAGVWEIEYSTALRKLAEAGLGPEHMAAEVHRMDRLQEMMKPQVWAEPVGNYFIPSSHGRWEQIGELPCKVPANWQGGFILHGYGPSGFQSTFSRTLPPQLHESLMQAQKKLSSAHKKTHGKTHYSRMKRNPNIVRCVFGATISAQTGKLSLQALAEHPRIVQGTRRSRQDN